MFSCKKQIVLFGCLGFCLLMLVDGNPLFDRINKARENMIELVTQGVSDGQVLVSHLGNTFARLQQRLTKIKEIGDQQNWDEEKRLEAFYDIVTEEISTLKSDLLKVREQQRERDEMKSVSSAMKNDDWDLDVPQIDDSSLINELDDKQIGKLSGQENEPEMGWGMDEESKENLQNRTKNFVADTLVNEVKTLASILITMYLAGNSNAGAYAPTVQALNVSIKSKLLEFVMQSTVDVLASFLGRTIEPELRPFEADSSKYGAGSVPPSGVNSKYQDDDSKQDGGYHHGHHRRMGPTINPIKYQIIGGQISE